MNKPKQSHLSSCCSKLLDISKQQLTKAFYTQPAILSNYNPSQMQTEQDVKKLEKALQDMQYTLVIPSFHGSKKKQRTISKSFAESEYRVMGSTIDETQWYFIHSKT